MTRTPPVDAALPVLPARDLAKTVAFYRDALKFEAFPPLVDYAIVHRDGVEFHFWRCDQNALFGACSCYIRVSDVGRWWDEYRTLDLPKLWPLELKPWGMRQFSLLDPDGNRLDIGQFAGATPR
jgi:catechol 2,3-dioxygenase-like lactoylglutathione lyase family enzyme